MQTIQAVTQFEGRKELISKKGPVFSTAIGGSNGGRWGWASRGTCSPVLAGWLPGGRSYSVCAVAGVMGAKRTSELLPFCHPISLDDCQVDIHFDNVRRNEVVIDCVVRCAHAAKRRGLRGKD